MTGKLESYLGFCIKSGKVLFGFDALCETSKNVKLVVVCPLVNSKVEQKLIKLCEYKKWTMVKSNTTLGDVIHRDNCKTLGVLDSSLAKAILNCDEVKLIQKGVL